MYVSDGNLQGPLYDSFNPLEVGAIKTVNFVPGVQFPKDSSNMFEGMGELYTIRGLQQAHLPVFDDNDYMFNGDYSLEDLDLSHFDTSHSSIGEMLGRVGQHSITLGDKTILNDGGNPDTAGINSGHWKNGNQILNYNSLQYGRAHPGTWFRQP